MNKSNTENKVDLEKRKFVKKVGYTAPVILTMAAIPSFASAGSGFTQSRPRRNPGRRPSQNSGNSHKK